MTKENLQKVLHPDERVLLDAKVKKRTNTSSKELVRIRHSLEFQSWPVNFKTEVCANSAFLRITMHWNKEVETAKSIDDLVTSQSITGRRDLPDYEMLDAKIASAFKKLLMSVQSTCRRATCSERRPGSHEEGRVLICSMSIFGPLEVTKLYKFCQICSIYGYRMKTFKISTRDGTKFY